MADIRAAVPRQRMRRKGIRPGDAVFFNTGWGRLWMKDNAQYSAGSPASASRSRDGSSTSGSAWSARTTWAAEAVPNRDAYLAFLVHKELLAKNGIFNHENLVFDELLADRKYQFTYVFVPVPIKGATGSPGCPIAIT